jgi:hypothetical protein
MLSLRGRVNENNRRYVYLTFLITFIFLIFSFLFTLTVLIIDLFVKNIFIEILIIYFILIVVIQFLKLDFGFDYFYPFFDCSKKRKFER